MKNHGCSDALALLIVRLMLPTIFLAVIVAGLILIILERADLAHNMLDGLVETASDAGWRRWEI